MHKILSSFISETPVCRKAHFGQQFPSRHLPGPCQEHLRSTPSAAQALPSLLLRWKRESLQNSNIITGTQCCHCLGQHQRISMHHLPCSALLKDAKQQEHLSFLMSHCHREGDILNQMWSPCSQPHDWQYVWAGILKSSSSRNKSCSTHRLRFERNNQLLTVQIPPFCTAATAALFLSVSCGKFSSSHRLLTQTGWRITHKAPTFGFLLLKSIPHWKNLILVVYV